MKSLDKILIDKVEMIGHLRTQLVEFYRDLKREEQLQQLYAQRVAQFEDQEEMGLDDGLDELDFRGQGVDFQDVDMME